MSEQNKDPRQNPAQPHPATSDEVNKQKQLAEQKEVAGRHKNDGQDDHKGAR